MNKLSLTLISTLFMTIAAQAQTVKWAIKPDYDKIERYSDDLFKCQKDGKYRLVDLSGNVLDCPPADSITDYTGGYALMLNSSGNQYQILGFLSEQGSHQYQSLKDKYYTTRYSYFSEGYIAVENADKKKGFLDAKGVPVVDFKYTDALPFKFGWAAVKKEGKDRTKPWVYVNARGIEQKGAIGVGDFTFASTFNDGGYALVKSYNKVAVIDKSFSFVQKADEKDLQNLRYYDYSYTKGDKNWKPKGNVVPEFDTSIEPTSGGSKYGYAKKGETIVPCQFNDAKYFANGYAIAAIGGKYGVLQLIPGLFEASWPEKEVKIYPYWKCNEVGFSLQVPSGLENTKLSFDNGSGMKEMSNGELSLKFKPEVKKRVEKFKVQAKLESEDGLLLWEGDHYLDLTFIEVSVTKKPAVTTVYADEYKHQFVKCVVTNNSNVEVKVSATLKVGGVSKTLNEPLAKNQSKSITVLLTVTEELSGKVLDASVSVTIDGRFNAPGASSTVKLQLI